MRFLLLSTDYPAFLTSMYSQHPGLEHESYERQVQVRAESLFGLADFYSRNLRRLGHEASEIDVNNEFMQKAWARQHGLRLDPDGRWEFRLRRGIVPWVSRVTDPRTYEILAAQIKHYRPDVLLNHTISLSGDFFREMKPHVRLMIGSHASPFDTEPDLGMYDLMLSVVDNFVDYFRRQGVRSELLRFGFEPAILERFNRLERSIPVSFVGNLFSCHAERILWLERLCERVPVQIWTAYTDGLSKTSPITRQRRGVAWGADMFSVLFKSRITLNSHVDVAEAYAGNLRLFEATGGGCLLITDWKKNLHEMFEPGKEIVAYRTADECLELIEHYLEHDDEREAIARAGQQRTLRDHTYYGRMQELVGIVQKCL
jgi:spore maturation protein CgeB